MGFNSSFSFLGIGVPELVFIVMLALVVLGPERLPSVAKDLVRAFFKVRNLSKDLTGQLEAELGVAELKELKGIKTGKLIEDWANDELDLDFDEDDQARKAAAQRKATQPTAPPKATAGAKAPAQVKKPVTRKPAQEVPEAAGSLPKGTQSAEPPVLSNGAGGMQKVEAHNVIGSANAVGRHPGGADQDMHDAAPKSDPAAAPVHAADRRAPSIANGTVGGLTMAGTGPHEAASKRKDGWQEILVRRRLLRTRYHGRPQRPDKQKLHLRIQRIQQRKQSPAFRSRAR